MKKHTKLVTLFLAGAMALSLAACSGGGGGSSAGGKVTGVYLSPANLSYQNMRPQYNYYLTTFTHEELTLMDNNTYCLVLSSSTFSALELAESTNDAKGNERANSIYKLYGACTSKTNDLDDDLLDVTLSAPTRVVLSNDQTYWLDTDNWNDSMGKVVVPPTGYDDNGNPIYDQNAEPWTAQQYLEDIAFPEMTIQVNQKTASFDYTDFGICNFSVDMPG